MLQQQLEEERPDSSAAGLKLSVRVKGLKELTSCQTFFQMISDVGRDDTEELSNWRRKSQIAQYSYSADTEESVWVWALAF